MNKKILQLCFVLAALGMTTAVNAQVFEHACKPVEVLAAGNRVHVKCAHPESHISYVGNREYVVYFALPLSSPLSSHLVTMASTALATGKWLKLDYNFTANTSFGCLANDCRPLVSVLLVPYALTPAPRPHHEPVE